MMRKNRVAGRTVAPREWPPRPAAGKFPRPAAILPIQFDDLCRRSVGRSGEQRLALAVVRQAVEDLRKHRWARRRRAQRLYRDAYEWVDATDRRWPYSFVNICEVLQLSPTALRAELLGDVNADANAAA
jgi:hypothetical protein